VRRGAWAVGGLVYICAALVLLWSVNVGRTKASPGMDAALGMACAALYCVIMAERSHKK